MNHREREQEQRIISVIGDEDAEPAEAFSRWYDYLNMSLSLPCEVTGVEDFQWEEFYVLGPGSADEYKRLRQDRPSYRDMFELTTISADSQSEWCMVPRELMAHVTRKADRKRFVLGLSELKTMEKGSKNQQLLHDYRVFVVNYL